MGPSHSLLISKLELPAQLSAHSLFSIGFYRHSSLPGLSHASGGDFIFPLSISKHNTVWPCVPSEGVPTPVSTGIAEQGFFNHCCLITDALYTTPLQYFCCHLKVQFLLVFFAQVKIFSMENVYSYGKSFEKFTVFLSQRDGPATAEQKAVHVDLCIEGFTDQYIKQISMPVM